MTPNDATYAITHVVLFIKLHMYYRTTEMGYKVGPRLRESRLLAPSDCGGEFTQPRALL